MSTLALYAHHHHQLQLPKSSSTIKISKAYCLSWQGRHQNRPCAAFQPDTPALVSISLRSLQTETQSSQVYSTCYNARHKDGYKWGTFVLSSLIAQLLVLSSLIARNQTHSITDCACPRWDGRDGWLHYIQGEELYNMFIMQLTSSGMNDWLNVIVIIFKTLTTTNAKWKEKVLWEDGSIVLWRSQQESLKVKTCKLIVNTTICPCTKGMNEYQDKATELLTVLNRNRDIENTWEDVHTCLSFSGKYYPLWGLILLCNTNQHPTCTPIDK